MKRVHSEDLDYPGDDGLYYYEGAPFTGIRVIQEIDFKTEEEFRHGVLWGKSQTWWPSGRPWRELEFVSGLWHGTIKKWHDNGQMAELTKAEVGIPIARKRWDEEGRLIEDYKIENDPEEASRLRKEWDMVKRYYERAGVPSPFQKIDLADDSE
ncbi:Hypothetical protein PBC10988_34550 [Planctomycetales bacterium 10988]|nr:Hypothetical protein PBC10988_34550 [Planctomycetales bacterium 10988]